MSLNRSIYADIGGGSVPNGTKYSLENISLQWMIKEILEAQPGIMFRDDPRLADLGILLNPKAGHEIQVSTAALQRAKRPTTDGAHNANVGADSDPPEHDDLPSPYLPVDARPQDVSSPISDKLKNPVWWFLEIFPFVTGYQDSDDVWHNHLRHVNSCDNFYPNASAHSLPCPVSISSEGGRSNPRLRRQIRTVKITPIREVQMFLLRRHCFMYQSEPGWRLRRRNNDLQVRFGLGRNLIGRGRV